MTRSTDKELRAKQQERTQEKHLHAIPERQAREPDSPFSRCAAYHRGDITREELLEVLSTWPYRPQDATDGYDSLLVDVPGSFDDVIRAVHEGLVDSLEEEDYSDPEVTERFYEWFPSQRKFILELTDRMEAVGNFLPRPAQYGTPDNPRFLEM